MIYELVRLCEAHIFSKVSREQMAKISAGHHNKMRNMMQRKKSEEVGTNLAMLPCKVGMACEAEQKDHFADFYGIYNFFDVYEMTIFSKLSREMTSAISARQRDNMQALKQLKRTPT